MFKKSIFSLLLVLNTILLFGQRPEADTFKLKKGELLIQPILHGTLTFQYEGKVIYMDPYGGEKAFEGITIPDLILITDIHGDHLNEKTLDAIDTKDVKIIVPQAVADKMSEKYQDQLDLENISHGSIIDIK